MDELRNPDKNNNDVLQTKPKRKFYDDVIHIRVLWTSSQIQFEPTSDMRFFEASESDLDTDPDTVCRTLIERELIRNRRHGATDHRHTGRSEMMRLLKSVFPIFSLDWNFTRT